MLCISEYFKIGNIILVERLNKRVNGSITTTMYFTCNTIYGDACFTRNEFRSTLLRSFLNQKTILKQTVRSDRDTPARKPERSEYLKVPLRIRLQGS